MCWENWQCFGFCFPLLSGILTAQVFVFVSAGPHKYFFLFLYPPVVSAQVKVRLLSSFHAPRIGKCPERKAFLEYHPSFMKLFLSLKSSPLSSHCFSKNLMSLNKFWPAFRAFLVQLGRNHGLLSATPSCPKQQKFPTMSFCKVNHPKGVCPSIEWAWEAVKSLNSGCIDWLIDWL